MASIFKRGKTWYILYFVDGKRVKRSLGVKSKLLAEIEKNWIEAEIEKGKIVFAPIKMNPMDAINEYMEEIVQTKSKPTCPSSK